MLPRDFQSRYRRHLVHFKRLSFNSFLRDDLLINFLVSLFTPCKNFTSVPFNLGKICLKQISSLFTIKSHNKESLRPIFLFLPLVVTIVDSFPSRECIYIYLCAYIYRALHGIKLKKSRATNCFAFFLTFLETTVFENAQKPASIRTRTKHTRHQSRDLFRVYRSMCVSFLCVHFYLHLKSVKDGQFSNACTYMCSYFLLKIFTRFDTFRADNTRESST